MNSGTGVSVVIATLGGPLIAQTIDSLMKGSLIPGEILICIPEAFADRVTQLNNSLVKILTVPVKGQVAQRAIGFTKANQELVLQLDDDILLEKDTLQQLADQLQVIGKKNCIGPVYYGAHSRRCIHELATGSGGFVKNLFDSVICAAPWAGAKMGKVTSIGINYGVDDTHAGTAPFQTEWLPGGCVLSWREDLIVNDFFPFEGKAYCEDVIHSFFRRAGHTRLWVLPGVRVYIDEPEAEFSKTAVNKVIQVRRYYLSLIKGPQWRLSIYEWFCKIRSAVYG